MWSHEEEVRRVAAIVRVFWGLQTPFRIYHGSTNSTRPRHDAQVLDISNLQNVVKIDVASKTALVEPNVPMDDLVEATLEHGLIPPVVMEFPGITVGGGYAGSAGESSSFKYGCFSDNVKSVEIVLGNSDVVTASRDERADVFTGAAGAAGTLGVITLLELQLIPAKRYVRLAYRRTKSVQETVETIAASTQDPSNDFVDGIMYSPSFGMVMTGQLTDDKPLDQKPQTFSAARDPWFYLHARSHSTSAPDYIPLAEYFFRYDRGGFWVGHEAFRYFKCIPYTRTTRRLFNKFMHTRMLYRALHATDSSFGYMVQDLALPYSTAADFIDYTSKELAIWPLWLCPLRETEAPTFHPHVSLNGASQPMLNIGVWGRASRNAETFLQQNRSLEHRLAELGGRKVLYSHTYYTEDEFWQIYDRDWYERLRKKYAAGFLPTVYEKVKVDMEKWNPKRLTWRKIWPVAGVLGARSAVKSGDLRLQRGRSWMGDGPGKAEERKEKE